MKRKRHILEIIILVLFLGLLFVIYSLGSFNFLIPQYFRMAGILSEKNYLIIFQNNAELRPSGGFITAYGILNFKNGIPHISMQNVYGDIDKHDPYPAPYPYAELLKGEGYKGHTFKDANIYPNFQETASELDKFYTLVNKNASLDGYIAVNYSVIEDLVGTIGEINSNGIVYTKGNMFSQMEYQVNNIDRHNIEDMANRKNFMNDLARKIIREIILSPSKWRQVTDLIAEEVSTKNIQIYLKNSSVQDAWSRDKNQDALSLVEINLGGMKSDRYISRNINYFLDLSKRLASVSVEILHYGDMDIPISGDYSGYFKLYIPSGSKVLSKPKGEGQVSDESDFSTIGTVVKLHPGEKTVLNYEYTLPESIFDGSLYSLKLLKQSGANNSYNITIKSGTGTSLVGSGFDEAKENTAILNKVLSKDTTLRLRVMPDTISPMIIYQVIPSLNNISIHFNEDVQGELASNPFSYEIVDINKNHPEKTDKIIISEIQHNGKYINLITKGMTSQFGEFYEIKVRNQADLSGNLMNPDPFRITVVQRLQ